MYQIKVILFIFNSSTIILSLVILFELLFQIFFIGLSIIVAISFASPTTTQIENPLNVDLLLESNTNKIHHLLKRQTSNRAIALANQLSGARGAPVSRGGGSSYGRKRRSPGEFVVDDVRDD